MVGARSRVAHKRPRADRERVPGHPVAQQTDPRILRAAIESSQSRTAPRGNQRASALADRDGRGPGVPAREGFHEGALLRYLRGTPAFGLSRSMSATDVADARAPRVFISYFRTVFAAQVLDIVRLLCPSHMPGRLHRFASQLNRTLASTASARSTLASVAPRRTRTEGSGDSAGPLSTAPSGPNSLP